MKNPIAFILICGSIGILSCVNGLKNKPPHWYDGYVYGTRAYELFCEGKLTSALLTYKKGLASAQVHDIPEQVALYRFNSGRCFYELDKADSAVRYFSIAYNDFLFCHNDSNAQQAAGYAALSYNALLLNDSAFAWYARGVDTTAQGIDKAFWLTIHAQLLWTHDKNKDALESLKQAFELYTKKKMYHGAAQSCFLQSKIYFERGLYDDALRQIDSALVFGDKSPIRFDRFRMLLLAASVYKCNNNVQKSQWFFRRAQECLPEGIVLPVSDSGLPCLSNIP